jgi:hypothetical protein
MAMLNSLLVALLIWLMSAPAMASIDPQDEGQDTGATQDDQGDQSDDAGADQETVVTDEHRAVWTLLATSAAKTCELNEDQTGKLIEIYVDARARFADAEDYMRDEWKAEMRAKLEEQRARGEITGAIFDVTELETNIEIRLNRERRKLGEALVAVLEREGAERIYRLLGGFDKRTDAAVRELIGFELSEDARVESVAALQQHYVEVVEARQLPPDQIGPAVRSAQETLIRALSPYLDREQLLKVARKAGVRFDE